MTETCKHGSLYSLLVLIICVVHSKLGLKCYAERKVNGESVLDLPLHRGTELWRTSDCTSLQNTTWVENFLSIGDGLDCWPPLNHTLKVLCFQIATNHPCTLENFRAHKVPGSVGNLQDLCRALDFCRYLKWVSLVLGILYWKNIRSVLCYVSLSSCVYSNTVPSKNHTIFWLNFRKLSFLPLQLRFCGVSPLSAQKKSQECIFK